MWATRPAGQPCPLLPSESRDWAPLCLSSEGGLAGKLKPLPRPLGPTNRPPGLTANTTQCEGDRPVGRPEGPSKRFAHIQAQAQAPGRLSLSRSLETPLGAPGDHAASPPILSGQGLGPHAGEGSGGHPRPPAWLPLHPWSVAFSGPEKRGT